MLPPIYDITIKKERNKPNWICHILHTNCIIKHVIEGEISMTSRRRRRRKQQLGDFKEKRKYWETERGRTRAHFVGNSLCTVLSYETVIVTEDQGRCSKTIC